MYLRECLIQNVGPIVLLDVSLELDASGNPKPVVLVGKNGTGKTIVLAYVVDALAELAKQHFGDVVLEQKIGRTPYFKIVSGTDSRSLSEPHVCLLEFADSDKKCDYVQKVGVLDPQTIAGAMRGRFGQVNSWPKDTHHKVAVGDKERIETAFQSGAICFFPASRHELPHWLNTVSVQTQMVFGDSTRIQGLLQKPLIVERAAESNRQWLMDVLLDCMADFEFKPQGTLSSGQIQIAAVPRSKNLQEKIKLSFARDNVEKLLRAVLEDDTAEMVVRNRHAGSARIGIQLANGITVPSLMHLSAGQSLLFNLFTTIIRYADWSDLNKSISLERIEGIVIIDEIEAHLHSDLQFEVLPRLLRLFPKVQFVVSSHSPLFLLGMEKEFGPNGVQILEMPTGRRIGTERFEEFRRSFDVYRKTKSFEEEVEDQLRQTTKPLVLTEGQTDPVLIRTALALLGRNDLLNSIEVDQVGSSGEGGSSGGGASHLNKARTFLEHNYRRFNRRVLLLYDNENNKPAEVFGLISVRSIPMNPANVRVRGGVENLLPEALFEERFYDVQEKPRADGGGATIKTLRKEEFCRWVCEERKNPADFVAFETYVVPILEAFVSQTTAGALGFSSAVVETSQ